MDPIVASSLMPSMFRTTTIRRIPARLKDRLAMQPLVQRALLPFGKEISGKRWVFVLGCYNSGTTLLANMLQRHPSFGGLPNEGAFLTDALPYPEQFGWPRMWAECIPALRIPEDDFERARRIRRQWSIWLRGNADFVVEKTVSNVLRVDFLANTFPEASFVYIVRDGYSVAAGIRKKANLRRWKNPLGLTRYPIEYCARQWSETDRQVRASRHFPDRIHEVRYEALTERPGAVMNEIWTALGAEGLSDAGLWDDMRVHGVRSGVTNMNAGSVRGLAGEDISAIRAISAPELDRYGYDAPGS